MVRSMHLDRLNLVVHGWHDGVLRFWPLTALRHLDIRPSQPLVVRVRALRCGLL
jgi:hypothetical protein